MQFRNVATEPDQGERLDAEMEYSEEAESESHGVSREDTMVEHSVVVNEDVQVAEASDYMHALECVKFERASSAAGPENYQE